MAHFARSSRRSSTLLEGYLQEILQAELLTAEQERELAEGIAAGDKSARERMIQANLRLVIKIAADYQGRGLGLDDLISEGNLGLIRAIQDFDPKFGTRFSTYASYWIKQSIRHALTNTTATIRLPAHMVMLLSRWRRTERELSRELGRPVNSEEIAGSLGLSESQRLLAEQALRVSQTFREGNSERGETTGWFPEEASDTHERHEDLVDNLDERDQLFRRIQGLDDRERAILVLRYGLEGGPPMSLKAVGEQLGMTREWVRKIEIRAVMKLDGQPTTAAGAKGAKGQPSNGGTRSRRNRGASAGKTARRTRANMIHPHGQGPRPEAT